MDLQRSIKYFRFSLEQESASEALISLLAMTQVFQDTKLGIWNEVLACEDDEGI